LLLTFLEASFSIIDIDINHRLLIAVHKRLTSHFQSWSLFNKSFAPFHYVSGSIITAAHSLLLGEVSSYVLIAQGVEVLDHT